MYHAIKALRKFFLSKTDFPELFFGYILSCPALNETLIMLLRRICWRYILYQYKTVKLLSEKNELLYNGRTIYKPCNDHVPNSKEKLNLILKAKWLFSFTKWLISGNDFFDGTTINMNVVRFCLKWMSYDAITQIIAIQVVEETCIIQT